MILDIILLVLIIGLIIGLAALERKLGGIKGVTDYEATYVRAEFDNVASTLKEQKRIMREMYNTIDDAIDELSRGLDRTSDKIINTRAELMDRIENEGDPEYKELKEAYDIVEGKLVNYMKNKEA